MANTPKPESKGKDAESKGKDGKPAKPGAGKSQTARRDAKRREERLKEIEEQVADGSLVIRKMTAAERAKYPPRPRKSKRPKR
jgi:hypothetical protein